MAIIEATAATFNKLIDTEYAVVDCYGDHCGACVVLEPVYHETAGDLSGIRFMQINITREWEIAERYSVNAMPTLLYFRNGREVTRSVGSMERGEMNEYIAKMLYQ